MEVDIYIYQSIRRIKNPLWRMGSSTGPEAFFGGGNAKGGKTGMERGFEDGPEAEPDGGVAARKSRLGKFFRLG